jgi:hypothetical protein
MPQLGSLLPHDNAVGDASLVRYNPRAAAALAFLKRTSNDIDVFVEDTGSPNMWLSILRRILPPKVRLKSVNQLGGRNSVLSACKLNQTQDGRRKLFIIDGDMDFILGKRKPNLKFLYRLRAYCIENLLVRKDAFTELGTIFCPKKTSSELEVEFDFDSILDHLDRSLRMLFCVFAVAQKLCPDMKTVSYSIQNLYKQFGRFVSLSNLKVFKFTLKLCRQIKARIGYTAFKIALSEIKIRSRSLGLEKIVSGKDYLIPFLLLRARATLGFKGDAEQLKAFLASKWNFDNEPYLARALISMVV